jgi:hypothetical protein
MDAKNLEGLFDRIRQHDQCRLSEIRTLKHQIEALQCELNQKNIVVKQLKMQVTQLCEFKQSILRSINSNPNIPERPSWEEDNSQQELKLLYESSTTDLSTTGGPLFISQHTANSSSFEFPDKLESSNYAYNERVSGASYLVDCSLSPPSLPSYRPEPMRRIAEQDSSKSNERTFLAPNPPLQMEVPAPPPKSMNSQSAPHLNAGAIASCPSPQLGQLSSQPTSTHHTANQAPSTPTPTSPVIATAAAPAPVAVTTAAAVNCHVGTGDAEGHDFFMTAKKQLTFPQFQSFLQLIKQFNQHERSKEQTLASAKEIFGPSRDSLYRSFHALLTRT